MLILKLKIQFLQMLIGLQAESVEVLKKIVQKGDVNWKLALVCVSTYVNCIPEGGSHMKGKCLSFKLNEIVN
jgi:hypothetical protein